MSRTMASASACWPRSEKRIPLVQHGLARPLVAALRTLLIGGVEYTPLAFARQSMMPNGFDHTRHETAAS
jgi:hypothetical protein